MPFFCLAIHLRTEAKDRVEVAAKRLQTTIPGLG